MHNTKPVIAITKSEHRSRISWFFLPLIVRLMGAHPMDITANMDYHDIDFDALILSGGIDIHPDRYDGEKKQNEPYDLDRDEMEFFLLKKAEDKNLPVLGICRGSQLMNIARGGTLHFDVAKAYERANYPSSTLARIFYRKRMYIENQNTLIYKILKCTSAKVNSIHSQAMNKLGHNLTASAKEENGVVQTIEDTKRAFYIGVQFHPEYLTYSPLYRRLFKSLINCAKQNLDA